MEGESWHKSRKAAERLLVVLASNSAETLKTLSNAELMKVAELLAVLAPIVGDEVATRKEMKKGRKKR